MSDKSRYIGKIKDDLVKRRGELTKKEKAVNKLRDELTERAEASDLSLTLRRKIETDIAYISNEIGRIEVEIKALEDEALALWPPRSRS